MKRRLFIIVLFLTLGSLVNVAVAWYCALQAPFARNEYVTIAAQLSPSNPSDRWITVDRTVALGCVQQELGWTGPIVDESERDAVTRRWELGYFANPATVVTNIDREPLDLAIRRAPWSRIGARIYNGRRITIEGERHPAGRCSRSGEVCSNMMS
jgi:hypothetical protein